MRSWTKCMAVALALFVAMSAARGVIPGICNNVDIRDALCVTAETVGATASCCAKKPIPSPRGEDAPLPDEKPCPFCKMAKALIEVPTPVMTPALPALSLATPVFLPPPPAPPAPHDRHRRARSALPSRCLSFPEKAKHVLT